MMWLKKMKRRLWLAWTRRPIEWFPQLLFRSQPCHPLYRFFHAPKVGLLGLSSLEPIHIFFIKWSARILISSFAFLKKNPLIYLLPDLFDVCCTSRWSTYVFTQSGNRFYLRWWWWWNGRTECWGRWWFLSFLPKPGGIENICVPHRRDHALSDTNILSTLSHSSLLTSG